LKQRSKVDFLNYYKACVHSASFAINRSRVPFSPTALSTTTRASRSRTRAYVTSILDSHHRRCGFWLEWSLLQGACV